MADTTTQQQRRNLFGKRSFFESSNSSNHNNSTVMEAQQIQESLKRTQTLLANELDRVQVVQENLEQDEQLLHSTMDTHKSLNVKSAKAALTSLQAAQQREDRILYASIVFFWTVVFYIAWCRVLSKLPLVERLLGMILQYVVDLVALIRSNVAGLYKEQE